MVWVVSLVASPVGLKGLRRGPQYATVPEVRREKSSSRARLYAVSQTGARVVCDIPRNYSLVVIDEQAGGVDGGLVAVHCGSEGIRSA